MQKTVELFKVLSDETRLRILNLLYKRELCVCDVMAVLGISQSKASRHLAALKRIGLLADRRKAQWMHYSLVPGMEEPFIKELVEERLRKTCRGTQDMELLLTWQKDKE